MPAAHHKEPLPGDTLSCPRNWAGLTKLAGGSLAPSRTRCPSAQTLSPTGQALVRAFPFLSKRDRPARRGWWSGRPGRAGPRGNPSSLRLALREGRARVPASCPGGGPCEFLRKPLWKAPKPSERCGSAPPPGLWPSTLSVHSAPPGLALTCDLARA